MALGFPEDLPLAPLHWALGLQHVNWGGGVGGRKRSDQSTSYVGLTSVQKSGQT